MDEQTLPIYKIKVTTRDGQRVERKAMDIEMLNNYIDGFLEANNPLYLNDKQAPEQLTLGDYKGLVCRKLVTDLSLALKNALGMVEPEQPAVEKIEPKQKQPDLPEPGPEPEPDDEEVIVLD
jgi:hypothetical protein